MIGGFLDSLRRRFRPTRSDKKEEAKEARRKKTTWRPPTKRVQTLMLKPRSALTSKEYRAVCRERSELSPKEYAKRRKRQKMAKQSRRQNR